MTRFEGLGACHRRLAGHREDVRSAPSSASAARVADGYMRNDTAAEQTADDLHGVGAEPLLIRGNVTSERVLSEVESHGPWNVVVHNAATGVIRPASRPRTSTGTGRSAPTRRALLSLARYWRRPPCEGLLDHPGSPASGRRA